MNVASLLGSLGTGGVTASSGQQAVHNPNCRRGIHTQLFVGCNGQIPFQEGTADDDVEWVRLLGGQLRLCSRRPVSLRESNIAPTGDWISVYDAAA